MSVVRSPVRSVVRSPVRSVVRVDGAGQSALAQILALSPSLLIWPANGSGWQGTSGGTLSAIGEPVGLLTDLAQLGGKTQTEWLAAPTTPELVTNGDFSDGLAGWTVPTGTNASVIDEKAYVYRTDSAAQRIYKTLTGLTSGRVYQLSLDVLTLTGTPNLRVGTSIGFLSGLVVQDPTLVLGTNTILFVATAATIHVGVTATSDPGAPNFDNISVREFPGNHPRAGTWATPVDSARPALQVAGGLTYIDPDGLNDSMSFLTALAARTVIALVRVPAGYSANERLLTNDAETVSVSVNAGDWTNTGSASTRINGASGATFAGDTWQVVTFEWGSAQAFTRLWHSATPAQIGSMDVAAMAAFNSPPSAADRNTVESIFMGLAA